MYGTFVVGVTRLLRSRPCSEVSISPGVVRDTWSETVSLLTLAPRLPTQTQICICEDDKALHITENDQLLLIRGQEKKSARSE